ncbi:MAG: helix-turn-helix transcriptional regulator [Ruminococcus sp.]|nr:helix-turn-helix transcriptional regulator [Ruminococcus sp.]
MSDKRRWFKNVDELMVLACLSQKPCYCSEVVEFINSYRDDEHKIEHNAVYTALYFLRDKKAVEEQDARVTEGKKRVYYNLTPAGRMYFEQFLRDYRAYISAAEDVLDESTKLNDK